MELSSHNVLKGIGDISSVMWDTANVKDVAQKCMV